MRGLFKIFYIFFIVSVNINGPDFFYTRELTFIPLVFFIVYYSELRGLGLWFEFSIWYFFTLLLNAFISTEHLAVSNGLYLYLGFVYLILLATVSKENTKLIIWTYVFTAVVVSIFIVAIWLITFYSEEYRLVLMSLLDDIESSKVAFILMIRERKILDWWVPGVYFGTAPILIPALGYLLFGLLNKTSVKMFLMSMILIFGLLATASRANLICVFALVCGFILLKLLKRGFRRLFFLLSSIICLIIFLFILALLSDTDEGSLEVKDLHYASYRLLFSEDILRTIFIGWAGGSEFYTLAYNDWIGLTELSYLESVRRFGLIATFILIIRLWIPPLLGSLRQGIPGYMIVLTIICYLFVAGTNPYLFGSIGFLSVVYFRAIVLSNKNF